MLGTVLFLLHVLEMGLNQTLEFKLCRWSQLLLSVKLQVTSLKAMELFTVGGVVAKL